MYPVPSAPFSERGYTNDKDRGTVLGDSIQTDQVEPLVWSNSSPVELVTTQLGTSSRYTRTVPRRAGHCSTAHFGPSAEWTASHLQEHRVQSTEDRVRVPSSI